MIGVLPYAFSKNEIVGLQGLNKFWYRTQVGRVQVRYSFGGDLLIFADLGSRKDFWIINPNCKNVTKRHVD